MTARTPAARPAWQRDVHEGLYALAAAKAPLLRARPSTWGEVSLALVADLAAMEITGVDSCSMARVDLEDLAISRLLQHFQGHLHAMRTRGERGAATGEWSSTLMRHQRQKLLSYLL